MAILSKSRKSLAAIGLLVTMASPAPAETFRVYLGERVLGTLTVEPPGAGAGRLATRMTNTPLGVGDGAFDARIGADGRFESLGQSSRESRSIGVTFEERRAVRTEVSPASEATDLSRPENLPSNVLDLVTGFSRLTHARGCPAPFRMYDGRRVVQVGTTGTSQSGNVLRCEIDYRVVAGPGHLSPLRFRSVDIVADYALRGGEVAGLAELRARAGLFELRVAP